MKEIKSATIEKLTNKIIRSFATDLVWYVPFLMLVMLEYRRAALDPETRECFSGIANWLVAYFSAMILFSVLRLIRIPILRSLQHKFYFYYVLLSYAMFLVTMAVLFVRGNFAFFGTVTDSECMNLKLDAKTGYDNTALFILMGVALGIEWLALLGFLQVIFFVLMLWALWNGIYKAATKMHEKFSVRRLIETVLETVGEGQL